MNNWREVIPILPRPTAGQTQSLATDPPYQREYR